jgi:hypothetical protein
VENNRNMFDGTMSKAEMAPEQMPTPPIRTQPQPSSQRPMYQADTMPRMDTMPKMTADTMPRTMADTMPKMMADTMPKMMADTMPRMDAMPKMMADTMPKTMDNMTYLLVYPEVYYRVQPYVMMVCDQMDSYSMMMPSQEMVEQMSDGIYEDMRRMYPDMVEYANDSEKKAKEDPPFIEVQTFYGRGFGMFGRHGRRRGPVRDLIDILLLSELFRRRRRFY